MQLTYDPSNKGIGAELSHIDDIGVEVPISFASRVLSDSEKNIFGNT